ncbi:MAG: hypothetical protein ACK4NF_05290 [Planctomycetota bacterium]
MKIMVIKLGEMLVTKGLLSPVQLEKSLEYQKKHGGRIGEILLALGYIDEKTLASFLATQNKLELVDLDNLIIPEKLVQQIPIDLIVKYEIIPIGVEDDILKIATFDPTDYEALNIISSRINKKIVVTVAARSAIRKIINELSRKLKYNPQAELKDVVKIEPGSADIQTKKGKSDILLKALVFVLIQKRIISKEDIERAIEQLTTYEELL